MPRLTSRTASITAAAVVAAGMLAAPAHAGFVITSTRAPSTLDATKDVIRFSARNDGANGSGIRLQTASITLSSVGAPLVFDIKNIDGDVPPEPNPNGYTGNDVNIFGAGSPTSPAPISNTSTGPAGSYVRIGANPAILFVTARSPENRSDVNGDFESDNNPVPAYTNRNSFSADFFYNANPAPDASTGTGQVFATAVVPTGTTAQVVARLFGETGGGFDVSATNTAGGVPEPTSVGLLGLGGLGLLARRRRA